MSINDSKRPRIFYGWWVVIGVFLVLVTSSGLGFYNLSVLLAAVITEKHFSVATASAATSLFFLTSGITGLGVAVVIDRYDPRWTIISGACICALALIWIGQVNSLWQLYAAFILFGMGFSASALLPATTIVARWFNRHRSLAIAIATTGLSVGGVLLAPLSALWIETLGLATASVRIAFLYCLGIIPITLLLIRAWPTTLGLQPDGDSADKKNPPPKQLAVDFKTAIRSRYFIAVTLAYAFVLCSQVAAIAHLFNLVSTRSDAQLAATALAVMAGCSMLARPLGGWLVGFFPSHRFAAVMMIAQALGLLALALADTQLTLLLAVALFGVSIGNVLMLLPVVLADAFGVRHFGRIYSVSQMVTTLGVAVGPLLLGLIHDLAGGYYPAFLVAAALSVLAFFILLAGRNPPEPTTPHD